MARTGDHRRGRAGLSALEAVARRARSIVALALLLAACARPQQPILGPARPILLAVVTWNMHAGAGDLRRLVTDLSAGALTGRAPDDYVVLLQEAIGGDTRDPAALARDRQLALAYEPVRRIGTRTLGNAILSTRPLEDTRTIELPRQRQPRAALAAEVTVGGQRLFVVNAHFENRVNWWRGLLFSDTARGRQARALVAAMPAGPGIAGGDLNTWLGPDEPAWKAFAARFPDTPPGRPEPTFRDRLVLDHLFFDVPDGWQVERRVLPDGYGSDHRPVIGIITDSF